MESNDSPEFPDRGETSDIPGLPSVAVKHTNLFQEVKNVESLMTLDSLKALGSQKTTTTTKRFNYCVRGTPTKGVSYR